MKTFLVGNQKKISVSVSSNNAELMPPDIDIEKLVADRAAFNSLVYTSIDDAIEELKNRWEDKDLAQKILKYTNKNIPKPLMQGFCAVLFRQVVTPNYELRRFMAVPDTYDLKPVFWEYHNDKFTSNNPIKHSLGKIPVCSGIGKKGGKKISYETIIDFNNSNGKKLKEVETLWGESLISFHHRLLALVVPESYKYLFDASPWFAKNKNLAHEYYKNYIALFVRNAILFENFVLKEEDELEFTKKVFLPAFFEAWRVLGRKPLIVALEPTSIEDDIFWFCHPHNTVDLLVPKKDSLHYNK